MAMQFIDGSRLVVEASVRAGADVFVGYPITPANLLYLYSSRRFPQVLSAPDEITTLQWMSGLAATGRIPMTATSFPGFALMIESINMAVMMELPMVIVLAQRLGPSTGTATAGAQGDLLLVRGLVSGGTPVPTLCVSDFDDCWNLAARAVRLAVELRTPVILLTSKEMMMTTAGFDCARLPEIRQVERRQDDGEHHVPYRPDPATRVPPFLPVGNDRLQVRLTASTHDEAGMIQHASTEAMANTRRLTEKVVGALEGFTLYELNEAPGAETLIVGFDITANAVRECAASLRAEGRPVATLIAKTLFPVPAVYHDIIEKYRKVIVAEENLTGQYASILFGDRGDPRVVRVNAIGRMIAPDEIRRAAER